MHWSLYILIIIALVFSNGLTICLWYLYDIFHWFSIYSFDSFKWKEGGHLPLVSICALVSIYSYKLTVSNGRGGHLPLVSICALVSIYSYKLTILNGVSLMTYGGRVHSFHWQFSNGGSICLWYLCVHWSLYILIS